MQVVPSQLSQEIIARTLDLEFGDSRFYHYGLFSTPLQIELDTSKNHQQQEFSESITLIEAQSSFCEHVISLIENSLEASVTPGTPGTKARVLIFGGTLRQLAMDCSEREISTLFIDPHFDSATEAKPSQKLEICREEFVAFPESDTFDLILLEGSYCYLDQLGMLSKARRLLSAKGRLLLFGEFLDDDSGIEYSPLANISSLHQLSERLTYELLEEYECREDAIRSLAKFIPLLVKHKATLCGESDIPVDEADAYLEHLRLVEEEFINKRRCFRILLFQQGNEASVEYGGADPKDIHSFEPVDISELFEKSFDVIFDKDLWNWKYSKGKGTCVVARLENKGPIVAHYGGAPREISYFGEPSMAIQPCDVMVHPDIRNQYGRGSLFFKVAATFLEREIGNTVNHLLGFGFPNQKTMNISIRMGLYEKTDDFVEMVFPLVHADTVSSQYSHVDFDEQNVEHQNQLNSLWQLMDPDFKEGIIGVRNWDYIKYRYFDHPFAKSEQYRSVIVSDSQNGNILAFAVLKLHGEHRLLMDIVCAKKALTPAITALNQLVAQEEGIQGFKMWITKSYVDSICIDGAIENELGIEIPCNSWNPGPSSETLYGAWWLTAGDMDFV